MVPWWLTSNSGSACKLVALRMLRCFPQGMSSWIARAKLCMTVWLCWILSDILEWNLPNLLHLVCSSRSLVGFISTTAIGWISSKNLVHIVTCAAITCTSAGGCLTTGLPCSKQLGVTYCDMVWQMHISKWSMGFLFDHAAYSTKLCLGVRYIFLMHCQII